MQLVMLPLEFAYEPSKKEAFYRFLLELFENPHLEPCKIQELIGTEVIAGLEQDWCRFVCESLNFNLEREIAKLKAMPKLETRVQYYLDCLAEINDVDPRIMLVALLLMVQNPFKASSVLLDPIELWLRAKMSEKIPSCSALRFIALRNAQFIDDQCSGLVSHYRISKLPHGLRINYISFYQSSFMEGNSVISESGYTFSVNVEIKIELTKQSAIARSHLRKNLKMSAMGQRR